MSEESSGVQATDLCGKILRQKEYHLLTRLLTAWCDNPKKWGGQLVTNKDSNVKNLWFVLPDISITGSLSTFRLQALDTKYWFLLLSTLKHPSIQTPEKTPNGQGKKGEDTQSDPSPPPPSPTRQAPPQQPPNMLTGTRSPPPHT